jgi:hypothetical protein
VSHAATLTPLAHRIAAYLGETSGVVGLCALRDFATENGFTLTEFSEALNELRQNHLGEDCHSCRSFITRNNGHAQTCPHGE